MQEHLKQLNHVFTTPTIPNITTHFEKEGFIRFNMIYISPITLPHLKSKLESLGMLSWELSLVGINFYFVDFQLQFRGNFQIFRAQKIFSLELDFEPLLSKQERSSVLDELESYLKGCDSIFFMSYFINSDFEILNNPLSKSIPFLGRRVVEKRKQSDEKI